jgi:hypothetical protein
MVKQLGAGILVALGALAATPPIIDESLRREALLAVFPGAMITVASTARLI